MRETPYVSAAPASKPAVKVEEPTRITAILTVERGASAQPREVTVTSQAATSNALRIRVIAGAGQ